MKIFQILNNICHWDASYMYSDLDTARHDYSNELLFVEAPDYVFEGWGYNPDEVGDARFIKPTPPEGWLYDDETGSFYLKNAIPPSSQPPYGDLLTMFTAIQNGMTE